MKALLVVISLTTVVIARPDIGLQLKEKGLATSYGAPSASITNLNEYLPPSASFQTPYASTSVPFYDGSVTTASPLFQSTVSSTPAPFYDVPSVSTTASPFISTTPAPIYSEPLLSNNILGSSPISSGGLIYNQGAAFYDGQQFPSVQSSQYTSIAPAVVQKHVYFYEAPDEPQALLPSPVPVEPPKRNVKIIFIKAPQYAQPLYPQIPVIPQNQEKTIVYVLVKKPEEQQQIVIPTQPPTVPAKPEVYFIKYKNQQEAEEKVSNTLNEHSSSGANIITSGIDTAGIASNDVLGNPFIGGPIISTTESPLGLLGGQNGFLSTSTIDPLLNNYYSTLGTDLGIGNNAGQYISSTESPLVRSTPYTFAPVHPTYGPPKFKK
ncbi:hypothetical protein MML48_1g03782 [Holotrichia oblita]|uniref:Uncharacterized protein n=1 Tax=Holotrichia oblita TaxID=644536 RepID=A0ACB9TVV8_HOLOL|nr:hypothetical protein MML48_1g03782 [Holotrichia oblita]